jgi:inhibitor of KinA sporulation pathway (predicted exonuclease)
MESFGALDTHLASNSYLGSPTSATAEDYKRCSSIEATEINVLQFPHLHRWHSHISDLMRMRGRFDAYGHPIVVSLDEKVHQTSTGSRYVAVLDFEKALKEIAETRSIVDKSFPCEIIEFPTVLVDLETGELVDEVSSVVKPKLAPCITPATTELTSITQEEVDRDGVSFSDAFAKWHSKMVEWQRYSPLLATCGDMDIQRSLPQQLEYEVAASEAGHTDVINVRHCFRMLQEVGGHRWCNIKEYFKEALGEEWETRLPWFDEAKGQREHLSQPSMLKAFGMDTDGHHHRGIDDCRNLAKLMVELYRRSPKALPTHTGELKEKSVKALRKAA